MIDPLYFLHIPKTAGTSFRALLESRFAPGEICPIYGPRDLFPHPAGHFDGYRLYRGHLGYTLPVYLSHSLRVLTLLREPASLVVSMVHAFKRNERHPLYPLLQREGLSLDDCITHPDCQPFLRNPQMFHLAYHDRIKTPEAIALVMGNNVDRIQYRRESAAAMHAEPGERLLEMARQRLDSMVFVGVTEQLAESVALLCRTLGWPPFAAVPRLNTSPGAPPPERLSTRTRAVIEELTRLDAQAYQYAQHLFANRLRAAA